MSAYARISEMGLDRYWGSTTNLDRLLFVDIDSEPFGDNLLLARTMGYLRQIPLDAFVNLSEIVVRWPSPAGRSIDAGISDAMQQVSELCERLAVTAVAYMLVAKPGSDPLLLKSGPAGPQEVRTEEGRELILRCRAVELEALVADGRAEWKPTAYHYRLPSGRHSETFLRVADALRHPRDCTVLAWWLLRDAEDDVAVIADTTSLTSLVLAFQGLLTRYEYSLGPVWLASEYPRSSSRIADAAFRLAQNSRHAVALLSVSSTGGMESALRSALGDAGDLKWTLNVLVQRDCGPAPVIGSREVARGSGEVDTWLAVDGKSYDADACELCRSGAKSRLVHIDHESFATLALPEPDLKLPSIRFADGTRTFWELCDRYSALLLDSAPDPTVADRRPHLRNMGVVVDLDRLIHKSGSFKASPAGKLRDAVEEELGKEKIGQLRKTGCVLLIQHEARRMNGDGEAALRHVARAIFGRTPTFVVDPRVPFHEWDTAVKDGLRDADSATLFMLGLVTGSSALEVLRSIQSELRREPGLSVSLVVVHARPGDARTWGNVLRSFDERVTPVWLSYICDSPSPLAEESQVLRNTQLETVSEDCRMFFDERVAATSSFDPSKPVMWGPSDPRNPIWRLNSVSAYGGLGSLAAFVAVGSAVHEARLTPPPEGKAAPAWEMFDVRRVLAAGYDPVVVSSVLRWLQPNECWWGSRADTEDSLRRYCYSHSASPGKASLMLGELLLAGILGKIPQSGLSIVVDQAQRFLADNAGRSDEGNGRLCAPVELGLELLDQVRKSNG